jgi:hypothetical protein
VPLVNRARRAANHRRSVTDALRLLADGGCPACLRRARSERQWITTFIRETNADAEVQAQVKAARGFCARHLRAFAGRSDAPFVLPATYADVTAQRLADLSADRVVAPGHACPVCADVRRAEADVIEELSAVSGEGSVVAAVAEQARLCLPHTIALVEAPPATSRRAVLDAFITHRAEHSSLSSLPDLVGDDPDLDARADLLPALLHADDERAEGARTPAAAKAIAALDLPSCPGCRARGVAPIRYLRWLGKARQDLDHPLEPIEAALCGRHLGELSVIDPLTAGAMIDLTAPSTQRRLDALTTALAQPTRPGARVADALTRATRWPLPGGTRRRVNGALAQYRGTIRACPACRAATVGTDREPELHAAGLGDARVRRHLEDGHGFCVEHAPALARRAGNPLPVEVLRGRLHLLGWELAESRRKREWWVRHEPQGQEMGAWRFAPTLLAGDTYAGLGAVESRGPDN